MAKTGLQALTLESSNSLSQLPGAEGGVGPGGEGRGFLSNSETLMLSAGTTNDVSCNVLRLCNVSYNDQSGSMVICFQLILSWT